MDTIPFKAVSFCSDAPVPGGWNLDARPLEPLEKH